MSVEWISRMLRRRYREMALSEREVAISLRPKSGQIAASNKDVPPGLQPPGTRPGGNPDGRAVYNRR